MSPGLGDGILKVYMSPDLSKGVLKIKRCHKTWETEYLNLIYVNRCGRWNA